jgi:tetratricopeptide (TPR) repeat protein
MSSIVEARNKLATGDAAGALSTLQSALRGDPSREERILAARAFRQLDRHAEAASLLEVALERRPDDAIIAHNLAAARGDAGDQTGAADAARRAIALRDAPESWLVLGRALQAEGDLAGAEAALIDAVARRPGYVDALKTLAQLIWMRSGDAAAALGPLHRALILSPSPELAALTCSVMRDISGPGDAYRFIQPWTGRGSVTVELAATATAARLDLAIQSTHAAAAVALAPALADAQHAWATARLAQGEVEPALASLERWLTQAPRDQIALGLQRTAWRLAGRPEALDEVDYRGLVRTYDIETPAGWPTRLAWLEDLTTALHRLHSFRAEPFGQSVRAGAQSRTDPRWAGDPVIDATFAAFEAPLAAYVADMKRSDPMGAVRAGRAEIAGAWSVRLTSGGRHTDHVHSRGWVSSAFYVTVPEPTVSHPKAGWLRFGATALGPDVDLPPEYWVEPRPGRLALFPSYLWHGTEPFSGGGERLTIAFDAQPSLA